MEELEYYINPDYLPLIGEEYSNTFTADGIVVLRNFLSDTGIRCLQKEADGMRSESKRIDLTAAWSQNTERHLRTISGEIIHRIGKHIPRIFSSETLRKFVGEIVGHDVQRYGDERENCVIIELEKLGDTHGGHVDEFGPVMTFILNQVPPNNGGELELLHKNSSIVELEKGNGRVIPLCEKDAYIMDSANSAHRITALQSDCKRRIFGFSYSLPNMEHQKSQSSHVLF